jgi:hypothetical protein
MQNERRRLELSSKLLQMGNSLIKEGQVAQDYTVTQSGTIMLLISGLLLSDEDMFLFSEICSMFSAKKILDAAENIDETAAIIKYMETKQGTKEKAKSRKPRKDNDSDKK